MNFSTFYIELNSPAGAGGGGAANLVDMTAINKENTQKSVEWATEAFNRKLAGASAESVASAELASDMLWRSSARFDWGALGRGVGVGVVATFASNYVTASSHNDENRLFEQTQGIMKNNASHDQDNIGIIANDV